MPIIKIEIDGEALEFKIIPLNSKIYNTIVERHVDNDGFIDRPGLLAHIVKNPVMSRSDWGEIPSSMITRISRSIEHYIDSIDEKKRELRAIYMSIHVLDDEVDDLYRFLGNIDEDDWAWVAIKYKEDKIKILKEKRDNIKKSLEYLEDDDVIFEETKEISYEVQ